MKKKLLKLSIPLLILASVFSFCKKPETKIPFPIEISFTEYSLPEISCEWKNLPYDERVIIINNSVELEKYISCTDNSLTDIDFSIQSILLVSGKTNSGITKKVATDLQQLSFAIYELNIEIITNDIPVIEEWSIALLVEKINEMATVELNINFQEEVVNYPRDIPFEEYSLSEISCEWKNLPYDERVIIINNSVELDNYINCAKSNYPEIDFSKQSLILVSGKTDSGIEEIAKSFVQLSKNNFKLDLEIQFNATDAEEWHIALITRKISNDNQIELIITDKGSIYPIDVPSSEYSLIETDCEWFKINTSGPAFSALLIINNNSELENYINCAESNYPEIDFSTQTLLLAYGLRTQVIYPFFQNLQKISSHIYKMHVYLERTVMQTYTEWYVPIVIDKIDESYQIDLIITSY